MHLQRSHAGFRSSQRSRTQQHCIWTQKQRRITVSWAEQKRLFCFGSGFTVTALLQAVQQSAPSWEVYTTQRTAVEDACTYRMIHIPSSLKDSDVCRHLHKLTNADFVLSTIPPDSDSAIDPVLAAHKQDLLISRCEWIGFLSSTAVYGEHEGQQVTEESRLLAVSEKLQGIIESEKDWLQLHQNCKLPVHIFRLGGIYGPGRSALDAVKKIHQTGQESSSQRRRSGQATTARVHVDDVVQALLLSIRAPSPGEVFNVVDDDCSSRATAMAFAAGLLDVELPAQPESAATSSTQARGEKKVSNRKAKEVLGWQPRFPSYREGLRSVFEQETFTSVLRLNGKEDPDTTLVG